jgi:hypothetical protein
MDKRKQNALQKIVNKKQKTNKENSLVRKGVGKAPPMTKPRTKLVLNKYKLDGWKENMPVVGFLKMMLKNKAVFLRGYTQTKFGERRKPFDDFLSIMEITYPGDVLKNCTTEMQCLSHLFQSKKLITKQNLKSNLIELSKIYE